MPKLRNDSVGSRTGFGNSPHSIVVVSHAVDITSACRNMAGYKGLLLYGYDERGLLVSVCKATKTNDIYFGNIFRYQRAHFSPSNTQFKLISASLHITPNKLYKMCIDHLPKGAT